MKTTILILIALACLYSCKVADKVNSLEIFNSKYVMLIEDTSKMMLIQDVVIQYGDLYVEADSALWEKPKQTVTAFGIRSARFKGIRIPSSEKRQTIKYTRGDAKFYTE